MSTQIPATPELPSFETVFAPVRSQTAFEETLERLRVSESLREKERMLIQQSRLAALGEMINNIAHQWRQPLNGVGLLIQDINLCFEAGEFDAPYLETTTAKVMALTLNDLLIR